MLVGYARVSTAEQNPDHQTDALLRAGVTRDDIHVDHASGAKASRPKLDLILRVLRAGDLLVVTRLDRLGRSVLHLVTLGAQLRERGVGLKVLDQGPTPPKGGVLRREGLYQSQIRYWTQARDAIAQGVPPARRPRRPSGSSGPAVREIGCGRRTSG